MKNWLNRNIAFFFTNGNKQHRLMNHIAQDNSSDSFSPNYQEEKGDHTRLCHNCDHRFDENFMMRIDGNLHCDACSTIVINDLKS